MITTIGYQGASFEAFRATLVEADIRTLLDVRAVAWSRRAEFTGRAISAGLAGAGIAYRHLPALGNPPKGRAAAADGRPAAFATIYRRHLAGELARGALAEAARIAEAGPVCLMCMERDAQACHRRFTAEALSVLVGGGVRHLVVPGDPRQGTLFDA